VSTTIRSRRGTLWVFGSACWKADRCDREKSIWSVTTGPDFLGVWLGLILTRVLAPPEEQDSYSRTARMEETGKFGLYEAHGASIQRYTTPATYIHTPPHTRTHTHLQVTWEIHAHAHTAIVYYDSLQLTSSMHKARDKEHRAHGQKEIMHAYGPKSTPTGQGLVEDINAMHAYGRSSAPIAQGLVYDIKAPHAFGLRDPKVKCNACLRA